MKIQERLARQENYSAKTRAAIRYLVIHFTANDGDTARNNAIYFAREAVGVSAHYFVDDHEIWRSVPEHRTAWHCGTKGTYFHPQCRNANSIGIELCSRKDANGQYYFTGETVAQAVRLVQMLRKKYNIPAAHILRHYDVTHKVCPEPFVRNAGAWKTFLAQVCAAQTEETTQEEDTMKLYKTYEDCPEWAQKTVEKLVRLGYLRGDLDGVLDLEHHMLRGLVINDRAGLYDTESEIA